MTIVFLGKLLYAPFLDVTFCILLGFFSVMYFSCDKILLG